MKLGFFVFHTELFHDTPGRPIFCMGYGHYPPKSVLAKSVIEPCPGRFRPNTAAPELSYHAIADLDLVSTVEGLQPRGPDHRTRWFPHHRAHSETVRFITRHVEPYTFCECIWILQLCTAKKLVHFRVRTLLDEVREILDRKFTEY